MLVWVRRVEQEENQKFSHWKQTANVNLYLFVAPDRKHVQKHGFLVALFSLYWVLQYFLLQNSNSLTDHKLSWTLRNVRLYRLLKFLLIKKHKVCRKSISADRLWTSDRVGVEVSHSAQSAGEVFASTVKFYSMMWRSRASGNHRTGRRWVESMNVERQEVMM